MIKDKQKIFIKYIYSLVVYCYLLTQCANLAASASQSDSRKRNEDNIQPPQASSIENTLENSEGIDGLFRLFRDKHTGGLRILLSEEDLEQEYLYFSYVENGFTSENTSLTRGTYNVRSAKLIRLRRYYDRIEWVEENTSFYMNPKKSISKSLGANISPAVIYTAWIEAEDKSKGEVLIQANDLFLSELFFPIKPKVNAHPSNKRIFSLGDLNPRKTRITQIRNYPENTNIRVDYVYENLNQEKTSGPEVTDPRFVSIQVQHTLLKIPENPMATRKDDPRIGYFIHKITDLSSNELVPYRDVISRFRLEKKHPQLSLSEPIKPIIFWLENTTPEELRPIIKKAVLTWNKTFEKAGFKNAIEIKQQPDDANWDAGDIRYNVIRWVSSPTSTNSGYGPSFYDPRTGEILGADIVLEFSALGEHVNLATLLKNSHKIGNIRCLASHRAHDQYVFGINSLKAFGASQKEQQRMLEEYITYLTLHEIGHTLGLNHNFRSNYLHSLSDIFKPELTYPVGLQGSVMDYPAIPHQPNHEIQNQFYTTRPGPYDEWAIEFGYHPPLSEPQAEIQRQTTLLARSTEPALAFGNDADNMSFPGKGIDPRTATDAQTSDPIGFAQQQINHLRSAQENLRAIAIKEEDPYQFLLSNHYLTLEHFRRHLEVISRYIGGVFVDRSGSNKNTSLKPRFQPVSAIEQRRAMAILGKEIFSPAAFEEFEHNAVYLLERRRGFTHQDTTLDPKFHDDAIKVQSNILQHLLHPIVLARMIDSEKYGSRYSIQEHFYTLTNAIFKSDFNNEVNSYRQNLQLQFIGNLGAILNNNTYPKISQSLALDRLQWVKRTIAKNKSNKIAVRAHVEHLAFRINNILDN